jgi:hypothetical protein
MMRSIGLGLGLSVLSVGGALAQQAICQPQPGCACVAAVVPGQAPGTLIDVAGDVKVAGPANFTPASTPFGLNNGYDVIVGPGSRATVNFGPSCQGFSFGTTAHVSVAGACACLKLDQAGSPPPPLGNLGVIIASKVVIGIGIAGFLLHKEETPDSAE